MKICFLANQLSYQDGWGRYAIGLLSQAIKQGIDCRILVSVSAQESDLPQIETYKILPPLPAKRSTKFFYLVKNFRQIRKLIQQADIVHSLAEPMAPIGYFFGANKPQIITLHGTYAINPFQKRVLKGLYAKIYKRAKQLVCVSRFTQQEILKILPTSNTVVIDNGVDYKKYQTSTVDQFSKRGHSIISVGALVFRKGYHIAIPAIAEVKKQYPDLKYYIVGSQRNQSYFKELKNLISQYHLENSIFFLEGVSDKDLIQLYYQADLFLLTPVNIDNNFEGFGFVYLEANACGKPVIGTYGCGAEGAIQNNFNGLLIPQNDIKSTKEAILKILDNSELAANLGKNGRQWAEEHDWQKVFTKYFNLYQKIK